MKILPNHFYSWLLADCVLVFNFSTPLVFCAGGVLTFVLIDKITFLCIIHADRTLTIAMSNTDIHVNFFGGYIEGSQKKTIKEILGRRMIENGCDPGSTVSFTFGGVVSQRSQSEIKITSVKAVNLDVCFKVDGNRAIKGSLKPGHIGSSAGPKMSLNQLQSFLKPVIQAKKIARNSSEGDKQEPARQVAPVESQKKEEVVRTPYTKEEFEDPDFQELIYIEIMEGVRSGKLGEKDKRIDSRTVLPYLEQKSFFDENKILTTYAMGVVLSSLQRNKSNFKLIRTNPWRLYEVVEIESVSEEKTDEIPEVETSGPDFSETPVVSVEETVSSESTPEESPAENFVSKDKITQLILKKQALEIRLGEIEAEKRKLDDEAEKVSSSISEITTALKRLDELMSQFSDLLE